MKVCNCKICLNNFEQVVNKLPLKFSIEEIQSILKRKYNIEISLNNLNRHFQLYEIELNNDKMNEMNEIVMATGSVIDINSKPLIDLNNLDFSVYDFDFKKPETIVTYIQKIHLYLYLKQVELTIQKLNEYENGIGKYPVTAINNLKKIFDLLDKTTGIGQFSDQQSALKLVEYLELRERND